MPNAYNENRMTKRDILKLAVSLACYVTVVVMGVLLNNFLEVIILFIIFSIINTIIELTGHKNHAPKLFMIDNIFMCYLSSCFLMFSCTFLYMYAENIMPKWQAIVLGIIITAFSTLSLSGVFYYDGDSENVKVKNRIKEILKTKTRTEIKELLKELPEREAQAIFALDFEEMTITQVADLVMHCSPQTVKNIRQSGYKRLNEMFKN